MVAVDIIDAGIESFTRIEAVQKFPTGDKMGIRDMNEFHYNKRPLIPNSRRAGFLPAGKNDDQI